jgi:hypothetical protein
MSAHRFSVKLCLLLALVIAGCVSQPTGPAGGLEYNGPSEQTVKRGQTLPGTDIQFVGQSADGAQMQIGGQSAIKKTGDSLNWSGTPVPGAHVALAFRILNSNDQRLISAGTVKITLDGVSPSETAFPDKPLYTYKALPVVYHIGKGASIPGTTLKFDGKTDNGAHLLGINGNAFFRLGDSVTWRGRLRPGVYADQSLRVLAYTDSFLDVTGLVTIGLTEE